MPPLVDIFPHFGSFAVLASLIGVPLSIAVGWVHLKRSLLYSSEADIAVEANPYAYKLAPGYAKELITPASLIQLRILRRLAETHELLTDAEKGEIERLEKMYVTLLSGGHVGSPRRKMDS